jgi:hypothetical protein
MLVFTPEVVPSAKTEKLTAKPSIRRSDIVKASKVNSITAVRPKSETNSDDAAMRTSRNLVDHLLAHNANLLGQVPNRYIGLELQAARDDNIDEYLQDPAMSFIALIEQRDQYLQKTIQQHDEMIQLREELEIMNDRVAEQRTQFQEKVKAMKPNLREIEKYRDKKEREAMILQNDLWQRERELAELKKEKQSAEEAAADKLSQTKRNLEDVI